MSPMSSSVWTFGPSLVARFGKSWTLRRWSLPGGGGSLGAGLEFSEWDPVSVHSLIPNSPKMQGGNQTPVISAWHKLDRLSHLFVLESQSRADDRQVMDRWMGNGQIDQQMGRSEAGVRSP